MRIENFRKTFAETLNETLKESEVTLNIVWSEGVSPSSVLDNFYNAGKDLFAQSNITLGKDRLMCAKAQQDYLVYLSKNGKQVDDALARVLKAHLTIELKKRMSKIFDFEQAPYFLSIENDIQKREAFLFLADMDYEKRFLEIVRKENYTEAWVRFFMEIINELLNSDFSNIFSRQFFSSNLISRLYLNRADEYDEYFYNFENVTLQKINLENVDMSLVDLDNAGDYSDYVFVARENIYYGAFKISDYTSATKYKRCDLSKHYLTGLRDAWNEFYLVSTRDTTNVISKIQREKAMRVCSFCTRLFFVLNKDKHICSDCTSVLAKIDIADYKDKLKGNQFEVGEYSHTSGLYFCNDDLNVSSQPTPSSLYLGVELEVDNSDINFDDLDEDDRDYEKHKRDIYANIVGQVLIKCDSSLRNLVDFKEDGSLDSGMELVFQPATLKYHKNVFDYDNAFEAFKNAGYNSHSTYTCGLHVHINRDFFGTSRNAQLYNGAKMVYLLEKFWKDFVIFSRRSSHALERWADKLDLMDDFDKQSDDDKTTQNLSSMFVSKYARNKYVALNLSREHTFELRIFRGTLSLNTYFATLQFVDNFARLVKRTSLVDLTRVTFDDIINFYKYNELTRYWNSRKREMEEND